MIMAANPLTEALLSAYRHDTELGATLSAAVAELERRRVQHLAGLRRQGCSNDRIAELTGLPATRIGKLLEPARELWQPASVSEAS